MTTIPPTTPAIRGALGVLPGQYLACEVGLTTW